MYVFEAASSLPPRRMYLCPTNSVKALQGAWLLLWPDAVPDVPTTASSTEVVSKRLYRTEGLGAFSFSSVSPRVKLTAARLHLLFIVSRTYR